MDVAILLWYLDFSDAFVFLCISIVNDGFLSSVVSLAKVSNFILILCLIQQIVYHKRCIIWFLECVGLFSLYDLGFDWCVMWFGQTYKHCSHLTKIYHPAAWIQWLFLKLLSFGCIWKKCLELGVLLGILKVPSFKLLCSSWSFKYSLGFP